MTGGSTQFHVERKQECHIFRDTREITGVPYYGRQRAILRGSGLDPSLCSHPENNSLTQNKELDDLTTGRGSAASSPKMLEDAINSTNCGGDLA